MSTTAHKQTASREPTPSEEDGKPPSPTCENHASKETPPAATEPEKMLPQFSYTKTELMEISLRPLANKRPTCLDPAYDNAHGLWDPEKWFLGKRRAESPLQDDSKPKREKSSEMERDTLYYKRRLSDPKERIKEEQDIILSPQRRSFGTGCHVTLQTNRRPESPCDLRNDRDLYRDPGRRIGSGRIISRDRDARQDRDFGFRSGERRDRFDRDDREIRFNVRSNREFPERRGRGRQQRIEEEEEPEWFSGGPTSQLETIELHGFDDAEREQIDADSKGINKRWRRANSRKNKSIMEEKDILEEDEKEEETLSAGDKHDFRKTSNVKMFSENSTGEDKAAASSLEENTLNSTEFDMNQIFELESLPAFMPNGTPPESRRGSRFSQWFRSESPSFISDDMNMSARSNDLAYERSSPAGTQDQSKSILVDLLRKSPSHSSDSKLENSKNNKLQELVMSGQAHKVHEIEAELKQLVLGNRPMESVVIKESASAPAVTSPPPQQQHQPPPPPSQPPSRSNEEDLTAFKKLLAQISEGHAQPVQQGSGVYEALDKNRVLQEKDVVQMNQMQETGEYVRGIENMMAKTANQMKILKEAPTEQDILSGNVKGQMGVHPQGLSTSSAGGGATTFPDFLMNFFQQPSNLTPLPQQPLQDDALCKFMINNPNLRPTSPAFQDLLGGQLKRPDMGGYQTGAPGSQSVRPPIGGVPPSMSNKMMQQQQRQHQREILASIVKQQQQQQQQLQQAAATAVQLQPPAIHTQPPTVPSPPPPHMNRVLSPSAQSPHHVTDPLASQPPIFPPPSTRIPSPLIFGQTPPLLSHAPSPIHPGQVGTSMGNSLNPNSLQVYNPQLMQRVPSPQELVLHTQQIMQNALIKSKLEEQKENYRKRQEMQHRTRSPNVPNMKVGSESSPTKMVGLSTTMAAFTPTSVMRKMHAEKDKDGGSKLEGGLQQSFAAKATDPKFVIQPMQQQQQQALKASQLSSSSAGNSLVMDAGDKMPRPLHGQGIMHSQVPPRSAPLASAGPMGRPIVKGNQGVGGISNMASNKNAGIPNTKMTTSAVPMNLVQNKATGPGMNGNFDVNKLMEHQRLVQRQLSVSPMPSASVPPSSFAVRGGTTAIHPTMRNTSLNFTPTNLLLRGVHANQQAALRARYNQMALQQVFDTQRLSMSQASTLQQSLRLGPNPAQLSTMSPNVQGSLGGMAPTKPDGQSMSLSSNCSLNNNLASSAHASSGGAAHSMSSNSGGGSSMCHSPVNNLSKWFSSEVLKQKLPDMPPVPKQKALSLEEVERLQQQTAVHN